MSGDKISDMTVTATAPAGTYFPLVVLDPATGLNPATNYIFDLGANLAATAAAIALRPTFGNLSGNGGAALIGTAGGITVQAALNATVSLAALSAAGGAALIGTAAGPSVQQNLTTLNSDVATLTDDVDFLEGQFTAFNTTNGAYYPNGAGAHVPLGATGTGAITGGSGGTNGTFALAFSGGNFDANPTGTFTVSGGAVTAITITGPGIYIGASISAPTLDFSASSGLTGAAATLTTGVRVASGINYWAASADSRELELWQNDSGTPDAVENPDATQISIVNGKILSEAPWTGGTTGDVIQKTGPADGDFEYVSLPELSNQPIARIKITDSANYQLVKDSGIPGMTATPSGDALRIQPTTSESGFRCAATLLKAEVGTYSKFQFELPAAPTGVFWGFCIALLESAPTPGDPVFDMPSDTPIIVLRGDEGTLQVLAPDGNPYPDVEVNAGGAGTMWAEGQIIECQYLVLTETSAQISFTIDGADAFTRVFSVYPATGYVAPGVYLTDDADTGDVYDPAIYEPSLYSPKRIYLNGLSGPGGNGTEANPFETLADAVASYTFDQSRGAMDIILKGGVLSQTIYAGTLPFNGNALRELSVRSTTGTRCLIDASIPLPGTWTNISGEFWKIESPPYYSNNTTYGGPIDVTTDITQAFGNTASGGAYQYTLEGYALIGRLTADTPITDPAFVRGAFSKQTTGPDAGFTIIRMSDGSDPNAHTFRWSAYEACIQVLAADQDGWNGCRVNVENIDMYGAFLYGLQTDRCMVDLTSLASRAVISGYGFELNNSGGKCYGLYSEGCAADLYHSTGAGTLPLNGAYPELWFWDCVARAGLLFTPSTIIGAIGADGFSNHGKHPWFIRGGEVWGVGKDCLSTLGDMDASGMLLKGAKNNGISIAQTAAGVSDFGAVRSASLRNSILRGNNTGAIVNITTGTTGATSTLTLDDILFDSNTAVSAQALNLGTSCSAIISYNPDTLQFAGPVPSYGHDFRNDGGTFSPIVTRAFVA